MSNPQEPSAFKEHAIARQYAHAMRALLIAGDDVESRVASLIGAALDAHAASLAARLKEAEAKITEMDAIIEANGVSYRRKIEKAEVERDRAIRERDSWKLRFHHGESHNRQRGRCAGDDSANREETRRPRMMDPRQLLRLRTNGFKPLRPGKIHMRCPSCGKKFSNVTRGKLDPPKAFLLECFCDCTQGGKDDFSGYYDARGRDLCSFCGRGRCERAHGNWRCTEALIGGLDPRQERA